MVSPITITLEPTEAAALIAFVFRQDNGDEIYTVHAGGGNLTNISNRPEAGLSPAWSPNGQLLAFISDRSGQPDVYLVRPDGSGLRQLTHTVHPLPGVNELAWSPDGKRLALSHYLPANNSPNLGTLEIVRLDGAAPTTLTKGEHPQWSPDGRWLAFDGLDLQNNLAVDVARGDGSGARMIVSSKGEVPGTSELLIGFTWAPDSSRLAYLTEGPLTGTWPNLQWGGGPSHARLITVRPDGGGRQILLDWHPMPDALIGPNWSPDGRYLLYVIGRSFDGCFTVHLFAVTSRTDTALQGVCYLNRTTLPDWSPDGRYLALSAQPNSILLLGVADALRHPQNVGGIWLTKGTDLTFDPVWQPPVH